jgi:DNA-binding NarL/FixJ family response regulator
MESQTTYRLLLIEDDAVIRHSLVSYLTQYHAAPYRLEVDACDSAEVGRPMLAAQPSYDLIISDINLPGEDGFNFLTYARQVLPKARLALITAYRVEDYVETAKEKGIFNIIAKTVPFDFKELSTVVSNLLDPSLAFGLTNYLSDKREVQTFVLTKSDDIMDAFYRLRGFFEELKMPQVDELCTALIEAITNAVYHATHTDTGEEKYVKGQPIEQLEPDEYVTMSYGTDGDWLGVSILDQGGRLSGQEILYWLERNMSGANVFDTHGRGLFLIHTLVDRLIVNIEPERRTEIILLHSLQSENRLDNNKPVYINVL